MRSRRSATRSSARHGSRPAKRRTGSGWRTGARHGRAGTVPAGGLFLTAGADVQKDRIEVDVWAWGRGLESWLVDHLVIEGGPGDPDCWRQLTGLLGRTWEHASGQHMTLARLAIDTGYETSAVYAWSRQVGFAQAAPVKGVEGFNRASPVTGPTYVDATIAGKRLRRGARLWTVATSTFKTETYRFLRQDRPTREEQEAGAACPPGSIHLPDWADGEWLKQLTAEQLITVKTRRGFARLEWQKLRERNEALDCRVYARAAAWILGADRWPEARWADLEAQFGMACREGHDRWRRWNRRASFTADGTAAADRTVQLHGVTGHQCHGRFPVRWLFNGPRLRAAKSSMIMRIQRSSMSSGSNRLPYHSTIRSCSSCSGSDIVSRNSAKPEMPPTSSGGARRVAATNLGYSLPGSPWRTSRTMMRCRQLSPKS